jgi:hypothetical protein
MDLRIRHRLEAGRRSESYRLFEFCFHFAGHKIHVEFQHTTDLCPFSNSQIGVQFSNLWPFLIFSNRRPKMSLTYAETLTPTLTNKLAIDLRIWKRRRFENTLKWLDVDLSLTQTF